MKFTIGSGYEYGKGLVDEIQGKIEGRMMGSGEDMGLLAQAIEIAGPGDYLEIGTFFGGSAIVACKAKEKLNKPGKVVCIDPYNESYPWRKDGKSNAVADKKTFWRNMARFGCMCELWPVDSMVADWRRLADDYNIVVVYVDGDHDIPYVVNDLWASIRLRPPFIVVDDYSPAHPGIMREVQKVRVQTDYELVKVGGKTAVLRDSKWKT